MTDSPPPSDRPKSAKSVAFALFRPVLFAIGVIGLALGGLVLTHRSNPKIAALEKQPPVRPTAPQPAAPPATIVLADPEPAPPFTSGELKGAGLKMGELKGFQMKPPDQVPDPEPPTSDRYELTLRLER